MKPARVTRSGRLLAVLAAFERLLIVTHDNPDPDAIAAGWALYTLVRERLGKPVRLVGGGEIVRAENRHMVRLLAPPLELVRRIDLAAGSGVVLVDCGAASQNHLFPGSQVLPAAVIDHHLAAAGGPRPPFQDIRPRAAASASIAAGYLREQRVELDARLATALMYAMRTETRGNETHYSRLDRTVLLWLTRCADPSLLAEIESAPLSPAYFGDLALALQNTFIYGDTALCQLPRASGPEIVGEVADLLIRCEGIERVLCGAIVRDDVVLSVRTRSADAAQLVRETVAGIGHGGGHRHRAGGKIPGRGGRAAAELLADEVLTRWLIICGIGQIAGRHLIPRADIEKVL